MAAQSLVADQWESDRRPLSFPFAPPACDGTLIDVVPGEIRWLRMPLPLALNHINLYLLRDFEGWCLVDTGFDTPLTRTLWEQIIPALEGPITGIICTHHHGDHCGLAGWLTEKLRVPLYMSRAEYFAMRIFHDSLALESWEYKEYYRRCGIGTAEFNQIADAVKLLRGESTLAFAYHRLADGDELTVGSHRWLVQTGDGHSPEHCSLHCAELGILLSGDQLLARISPNVGVLPFEPDANPLAEWLAAIERVGRLPDDALVLPAHELPFFGLGRRAFELKQHHLNVLERLVDFCKEKPDTVCGLSRRLFKDRHGPLDSILAVSETQAHISYLWAQGRVTQHLKADGSFEYRLA